MFLTLSHAAGHVGHHTHDSVWHALGHIIEHTLAHSLVLIPFLFITYLAIEFIEHRSSEPVRRLIARSGKFGPLLGGLLGAIPQCGFGAAASNLYAQGLVTGGTLLAIFLSTSDEMLPIMIAGSVAPAVIAKVLLLKIAIGVVVGFIFDRLIKRKPRTVRELEPHHDHDCDCDHNHGHDHCCGEHGIFRSAVKHTVSIMIFIILVTLIIELIIHFVGEDKLGDLVLNKPVIGPILTTVLGLIPNCAGSVVITQLYLSGAMSTGAMISGLLAASGVGILILFRSNRERMSENLTILAALVLSSALSGIIIDLIGLTL